MKHRRCRPPPPGMRLTFRCRWRQLGPTLERSLLVGSRRSAANQRERKQRACQGGGRQRGQNKSAPWVHADYTGYIKRACNPGPVQCSFPESTIWGDWLGSLEKLASMVLRNPERVLSVLAELRPLSAVGPVAQSQAYGDFRRECLRKNRIRPGAEEGGGRAHHGDGASRCIAGTAHQAASERADYVSPGTRKTAGSGMDRSGGTALVPIHRIRICLSVKHSRRIY